jgi:hypothetical protein
MKSRREVRVSELIDRIDLIECRIQLEKYVTSPISSVWICFICSM